MKLLLISNMYPSLKSPHYGTFVKTFENGLTSREVEVKKIVILKSDGFFKKLYSYIKFFLKVIFECNFKARKYDVIYVHFLNHSLIPFFFINKKRISSLVLNSHGTDIFPQSKFSKTLASYTSRIFKFANKIIVPSTYFKNQILSKFDVEENNIYISPSGGVDLTSFHPNLDPQEVFTIGFLSRLDKGKRWDVLIEVAKILKQRSFPFRMLIAGGGSDSNKMNKLIKALGVEKEIKYLGPLGHEEVPAFFRKIDIFVFPSERESLGLVAVESLASGVPVICFNNGAVNEFIKEGYNGFIYEDNSPSVVANKILEYNNLPKEEKLLLGKNAHLSANKFSNEIISQKLLKVLKSSLNL